MNNKKPFCCFVGCGQDADVRISAEAPGIDPYDAITESCLTHLGEMLSSPSPGPVAHRWSVELLTYEPLDGGAA